MTERHGHPERLWDPGVQNERTCLAWSRTGLALATCAALEVKLALLRQPGWAIGAALAAAVLAVAVSGWAQDRYRRAARRLHADQAVAVAGPALLLSTVIAMVGLLGLVLVGT